MRERTLRKKNVFRGRLISVEVHDVELESGIRSTREIVRHPGAVAVLARRPDGRFVFVRQFRKAIEKELLEVVAGTRDRGESPAKCARRELEEETGYRVIKIRKLGVIVSAPGFVDEFLHVYFAEVGALPGKHRPDHDEVIKVVLLGRKQMENIFRKSVPCDAKTLAALQLYGMGLRKRGS